MQGCASILYWKLNADNSFKKPSFLSRTIEIEEHFNLLSPILIFTVSYKVRQNLMLCMNSFSDLQCESETFQIHVQTKTHFSVA